MTAREKFGRSEAEWDEIVAECVRVLEDTARDRHLISYSNLAARITTTLGTSPPIDHHLELSHILYDAVHLGLESWSDRETAPLLSVLAVTSTSRNLDLAISPLRRSLAGAQENEDEQIKFWSREVQALYQHYREH